MEAVALTCGDWNQLLEFRTIAHPIPWRRAAVALHDFQTRWDAVRPGQGSVQRDPFEDDLIEQISAGAGVFFTGATRNESRCAPVGTDDRAPDDLSFQALGSSFAMPSHRAAARWGQREWTSGSVGLDKDFAGGDLRVDMPQLLASLVYRAPLRFHQLAGMRGQV